MTAFDLTWQRAARWIIPLLLTLAGVTTSGCRACNDCDFTGARCNGNAVEQCGYADQVMGRRVRREPCKGLNPVCVPATAEQSAVCARSAERRCKDDERRCEGNTIVTCKHGVEVAFDCSILKEGGPNPDPDRRYFCTTPPGKLADCRSPDEQ